MPKPNQTVQPLTADTAETVEETPETAATASPAEWNVCCLAISKQPFRVQAATKAEAEAIYREACKGLSPDAELDIKPVA